MEQNQRRRIIRRTGLIGIFTNIGLGIIKIVFGLLASSIAMVSDSFNNLTDALSSTVTVIGNKLAYKAPTKKHPFGYGRIEYIASFVVSTIILVTCGLTIYESIQKIIDPGETNYTVITIVMISIAIVVKIVLGLYTRHQAKKTDSLALKGSGTDALFDAIITTATLVGAIISMTLNVNIEGYLGLLIAVFIGKTGVEMILETSNLLIGKRYDAEVSSKIKEIVLSFPEVIGVFDLYLNDYGPEKTIGSLHIEVPGSLKATQIDELTRKITTRLYQEVNTIITIGIYANNDDPEAKKLKKEVTDVILAHKEVIQVHGFHRYQGLNTISIDVVLDYNVKKREKIYELIAEELKGKFPEFEFIVVPDIDTIE